MGKMKIAAIEFGTSKIVTIIGKISGSEKIYLMGSGTVPYDGFQDGDWNTPGQMIQRVRDSISAAELESNQKITEVYVGVPGEYIRVRSAEAEVELDDRAPEQEDFYAVQDAVAEKLRIEEMGGVVLHRSAAWYQVDENGKGVEVHERGNTLRGQISYIIADEQFISDVTEILGALGVTILGFMSSTLGEAKLMIGLEDRDRTAALIDCGYLSTEISVMRGDALIYHAMLPMGGGHITADLATELRLPMRSAEQLKRKYAFNADEFDEDVRNETYDASGHKVSFPADQIKNCVEKSMKELTNMINMTMSNDVEEFMGPRSMVYLTGGGLKMRGAREYLEIKIERAIANRVARSGKLSTEIFDSAQGLLDMAFEAIDNQPRNENGFGSKMTGFLRKK